ncbi:MAG TPA: Rrf2 family transcriptional regulator [Thermoanaerobaculaceae bacterium]|nr:Rrf2 family transcriptional regulator [Thermoanaerobaculaceae bacterium]
MLLVIDTDAYRIEAALELAAVFPAALPAAEIARRRGVPRQFLARLLSGMVSTGVVATSRGPNGGARLSRPPREVALSELLRPEPAPSVGGSAVRWLAGALAAAERDTLESLTLGTLLDREREQNTPGDWAI